MIVEVRLLRRRVITQTALIRLISGVLTNVNFNASLEYGFVATHFAAVSLAPEMHLHVTLELALVTRVMVAERADVGGVVSTGWN